MTTTENKNVTIKAPNLKTIKLSLTGTAPYVQLRFGEKAINTMRNKMKEGTTAKGKKVRVGRDYDQEFKDAMHVSEDGWIGIPASAFRSACISACRLVNFKMTLAKLSVFVVADGIDSLDGTPLIRIHGEPEKCEHHVRNATGVADIRTRAMFRKWTAEIMVRYDADQFTETDVVNLISRAGMQVGIGEGRPDSKNSAGMGWGTFEIA
jgi:hypothetical protein